MCACEPDFTCARCAAREEKISDRERERFEEMLYTGEWPDRIVPALADLEAHRA
jgi:hypothetical protein